MAENKLFGRAYDLGQPINSSDGLKKLWINWTVLGIHMPENKSLLWRIFYYIYAFFVVGLCAVIFPASVFLYVWYMKSWDEVVNSLAITTSVTTASMKHVVIFIYISRMVAAKEFIKSLDERCNQHDKDRLKILRAIRKSNALFMIYFISYYTFSFSLSYISFRKHKLSYNLLLPTFSEDEKTNFLAALAFQSLCQCYTCAAGICNDVYSICYVTLITAHLDALADRIKRIGFEPTNRAIEENVKELRNCVMDHKNLMNFIENIRPAISLTLSFQFAVTALSLCIMISKIVVFDNSMAEDVFAIFYLILLMFQVFPCCWYVNVLMEKTDYLTTAMYSCNWMEMNQKFRKMLIIFMQRSQKATIILAGNMIPVTVQTFLSIIRFSFSMYTLLDQMYNQKNF